jgi:dTMP kinase
MEKKFGGFFVVFEGLDGSGSSTQAKLLSDYLKERGYIILLTKEPTNNLIGGLIRGQLTHEWKSSQECLQLLFAADRAHHLKREILPALKNGYIVISDRYIFSSIAFGGLDLDMRWLEKINEKFLMPDVAFLLKVSPEICLQRIGKRDAGFQLFEEKEKLNKIWGNYKVIQKRYENIHMIDGGKSVEKVHGEVVNTIDSVLRKGKKSVTKTLGWYI